MNWFWFSKASSKADNCLNYETRNKDKNNSSSQVFALCLDLIKCKPTTAWVVDDNNNFCEMPVFKDIKDVQ